MRRDRDLGWTDNLLTGSLSGTWIIDIPGDLREDRGHGCLNLPSHLIVNYNEIASSTPGEVGDYVVFIKGLDKQKNTALVEHEYRNGRTVHASTNLDSPGIADCIAEQLPEYVCERIPALRDTSEV